jgi:hypothetical protein
MAVFVLLKEVDISVIGISWEVLGVIGKSRRTRLEIGSSLTFAMSWTCLSLVAIQRQLQNNSVQLSQYAGAALSSLCSLYPGDNPSYFEMALRNARRIDERFAAAWNHVESKRQAFALLEEEVVDRGRIKEILRRDQPVPGPILNEVENMERQTDASLSKLQQKIDEVTHDLIRALPGVAFDDDITDSESTTVERILYRLTDPVQPQLIYFSKLLRGLYGVNEQWYSQGLDVIETLRSVEKIPRFLSRGRLMERQFWRLEDLKNGGFGFTLELYFLSIRRFLSTLSLRSSLIHSTVFVNTFRAITCDRGGFTKSIGTLLLILNLVNDIAFRDHGIFSNFRYPDCITWELLDLLGRMLDGQAGAYIEATVAELLRDDLSVFDTRFRQDAVEIIQRQRQAAHLAPH